jgi:hypothetical protein
MLSINKSIPQGLRTWFVIHFAVDMLFGIPLLFFPHRALGIVGWNHIDPVTSRLVGAALLGIGGESLLGRNVGLETFQAMLNLKIIWAAGAVLGIALGIRDGATTITWGILGIFALFLGIWTHYRIQLMEKKKPLP